MAALRFDPRVMREAARRFERGAEENHEIMVWLRSEAPLFDVPKRDLAQHVMPDLTLVRRHASDRRAVLREMARFIRARALLAEIADGAGDARDSVGIGDAAPYLRKGAAGAVDGVRAGISRRASDMEREFLAGGWLDANRRLRGRSRTPLGAPPSWRRLARIARRMPVLTTLDNAAQMFEALLGGRSKGKRIEAASGVLGAAGASALGVAATIALMSGGPVTVGIVALGVAIIGSEFGNSAGRFIGRQVITPLWNGVKDIGRALESLGGRALSLGRRGLRLLGLG